MWNAEVKLQQLEYEFRGKIIWKNCKTCGKSIDKTMYDRNKGYCRDCLQRKKANNARIKRNENIIQEVKGTYINCNGKRIPTSRRKTTQTLNQFCCEQTSNDPQYCKNT